MKKDPLLDSLEKQADGDDQEARVRLGLIYEIGLGVPKDLEKASKHFSKAAKGGSAWAQFTMSQLVKELGGKKEDSVHWLNMSAKGGFVDPSKALANLEQAVVTGCELIKPRILVVDPSKSSQTTLAKILEKLQCETIIAENGEQGLAKLKRHPDVSLVILDLDMPKMDGLTMCRKIKSIADFNHVHLIILTGESRADLVVKAKKAGVTSWIIKPAQEQVFKDVLQKLKISQAA